MQLFICHGSIFSTLYTNMLASYVNSLILNHLHDYIDFTVFRIEPYGGHPKNHTYRYDR